MLISGCHRSGTSLLAGICAQVVPQRRQQDLVALVDNPTGYFESHRLRDFNDGLLQLTGHSWHRPPLQPLSWHCGERMQVLVEERPRFADQALAADWLDKDPRLCLTFQAFEHLLLKREPLAICVRDPLEVAVSLFHRDGIAVNQGLLIWYLYNRHASRHLLQGDLVMLYEELLAANQPGGMAMASESLWAWLQTHLRDQSLLPATPERFQALIQEQVKLSLNRSQAGSSTLGVADTRLVELCHQAYRAVIAARQSSRMDSFRDSFDLLPGWLVDHYDRWMRQGEPDLEYRRQQVQQLSQRSQWLSMPPSITNRLWRKLRRCRKRRGEY